MFLCKSLHRHRFLIPHFKSPNPPHHLLHTFSVALQRNSRTSQPCSTNQRSISSSTQFKEQGESNCASSNATENGDLGGNNNNNNSTKPYDVLFKEAAGLMERSGEFWDGGGELEDCGNGNGEAIRRLRELELELKVLSEISGGVEPKGNSGRRRRGVLGKAVENASTEAKPNPVSSLYLLFGEESSEEGNGRVNRRGKLGGKSKEVDRDFALFDKKKDVEGFCKDLSVADDVLVKELSPEMEVFVRHLYDEGYFKDVNFLPGNRFDIKGFESAYAQDFLKFAAERFGRDKQEVAKWLSGSDLKTLAGFGCPSLAKKSVFAAKSLRTFFQISENTVCGKCVLKESCKFVNQSVWKSGSKNLNLPSLMRLLTAYALDAAPPPLVLSEEIKACVNRLMKDVINLSKTVQDAA